MHDTHDLGIITDRKWVLPAIFLNSIKNVFNVYGEAAQSTAFSTIISSAVTDRMVFQKILQIHIVLWTDYLPLLNLFVTDATFLFS